MNTTGRHINISLKDVSLKDILKELEKEVPLSPLHRILLTTDGSITRILEIVEDCEIAVETVAQEIIPADTQIARKLNIEPGDDVNHRIVNLKDPEKTLIRAVSYTPLSRLKKEFREEIMKKDIPIGKIMSRLKIEARREIRDIGITRADSELSRVFNLPLDSYLLKRNYDIIHQNEILLNITEIFPPKIASI